MSTIPTPPSEDERLERDPVYVEALRVYGSRDLALAYARRGGRAALPTGRIVSEYDPFKGD